MKKTILTFFMAMILTIPQAVMATNGDAAGDIYPTASTEESLDKLVLFHSVLGDVSREDITYGTIVSNGKAADIRDEDLREFLDRYWNFTYYERVISPRDESVGDEETYIKLWNTDRTKSYVIYEDSGVILGTFGEPVEFHGEIKKNYVWYLPAICNGRISLYSAFDTVKHTYFDKNYEGYFEAQREVTDADKPDKPTTDMLNVNGSSEWAKSEIKRAAAYNLLVYDLTDKYTNDITRKEFCNLAYKTIITSFNPTTDSRMGEWGVANSIIEERGLTDTYNAVNYTDYTDDKIKFLSSIGIINGMGDGTFAPDDNITREQAATILYRMTEFLDKIPEVQPGVAGYPSNYCYTDAESISDWARNAVMTMRKMGIMNGVSENEFSPQGKYTVEQAIATELRLYEYCNKDFFEYETDFGTIKSTCDYKKESRSNEFFNKTHIAIIDEKEYIFNTPSNKIFVNDGISYIKLSEFVDILNGECYMKEPSPNWINGITNEYEFNLEYDTTVSPELIEYNGEDLSLESIPDENNYIIDLQIDTIMINGASYHIMANYGIDEFKSSLIVVNNEIYIPVHNVTKLLRFDFLH